jgi:hypothetical protein
LFASWVCHRQAPFGLLYLANYPFSTDRKTANKELNRLLRREKEQDLDSKQKARLEAKIQNCRINLNYTIYYPLTEKYLSIYPKSNGKPEAAESGSDAESSKKETKTKDAKPPLWAVVAKCMEDNTLDLLREGKLNINFKGEKIQTSSSTVATTDTSKEKSKKKEHQKDSKGASQKDKSIKHDKKDKSARGSQTSKHNAPQEVNAEDDESDGGFFE